MDGRDGGERGTGESVLAARHEDDDDDGWFVDDMQGSQKFVILYSRGFLLIYAFKFIYNLFYCNIIVHSGFIIFISVLYFQSILLFLLYDFICLHIRGEFNKFPDIFVQAFRIVVDSWKFAMLLLYILWDDWSILMISGSNEQLQQELEYTLLKPDCHSWWISKMQSRLEDTLEERYAIKFCFKLGKNATET